MISVEDMAQARENRNKKQNTLLEKYHFTLVCLTMNIPGPDKTLRLVDVAFKTGYSKIISSFTKNQIIYDEHNNYETGYEGYFIINDDPVTIKKKMIEIEDENKVGRLYDIDVIDSNYKKISRTELGYPMRKCLICDKPSFVCSRSRSHSLDEMLATIRGILDENFR